MGDLPDARPARKLRSAAVVLVLFGGLGAIFMFGAAAFGLDAPATVEHWLGMAGSLGPWALPVAVIAFTALAMLGVPQIALVGAGVVAFGPTAGFVYCWIGNLVASTLGWLVGRLLGEEVVRAHAGPKVTRLMRRIADNGFWTCVLIRLAPTVPFMIVNMAAGVAGVRGRDFVLGTALGSIPKIALVVLAGRAALRIYAGGGVEHYVLLAVTLACWLVMGYFARRWMREGDDTDADLVTAQPS